MSKTDYKKEYMELKTKYDFLEKEFRIINNQLYYIKCSRLYKITEIIRKVIRPLRNILRKATYISIKLFKLKKFLKNTERLVIIPSSFEFDEFVNQRPINYAKFLAKEGYKVLFVVWQWDKQTIVNNSFKTVAENIFQIPLYDFLKKEVEYVNIKDKTFFITFPHELFSVLLSEYRQNGFRIHYDNMDEWEEFQKVGQADWYKKEFEEKIILESDVVSAVSPFLIEKFSYLRKDILLSPNGYYNYITGEQNKNIARKSIEDNKINIGYFGHLTDSWFDWDLVFEAAEKDERLIFHLIGYGASNKILQKIEKTENIKFYGKIQTNQLYKYVKDWNFGIIPFKKSNLAKAVDPIKIYEYLYMGLSVLVTGIEHLKSYPKTYVVKNSDELITKINELLKNNKNIDINKFLEDSRWESRFKVFLKKYDRKTLKNLYEK